MGNDRQLLLFQLAPAVREDPRVVIRELTEGPCHDCRLGLVLHRENRGLIWKGDPEARLAILSEAPGRTEMERGVPLCGASGMVFEKWCAFLQLNSRRDMLVVNTVQCMPPNEKIVMTEVGPRHEQRKPKEDEINTCFPKRGLRLLRSMPNLEVVICLGLVAAETLLGQVDPEKNVTTKSHENRWFRTSLLPGVAVYVMIHPSAVMREPSPEKAGKVLEGLRQFKKEYLELHKVNAIVRQMEAGDDSETSELT